MIDCRNASKTPTADSSTSWLVVADAGAASLGQVLAPRCRARFPLMVAQQMVSDSIALGRSSTSPLGLSFAPQTKYVSGYRSTPSAPTLVFSGIDREPPTHQRAVKYN